MNPSHLEVCVDSLEGALIAQEAGATRIELSQQLEVGGLTPTRELLFDVCRNVMLPIIVLIRCKPGGFQYTPSELEIMKSSAVEMKEAGVHGIAVGASDSSNALHWPFLEEIANLCCSMELVVHRVFDGVEGQLDSFQRLAKLGYRRILTSGGPANAMDGLENLRHWNECCRGSIEILPAGGIRPLNALTVLRETGCHQLHGSFSHFQNGKRLPIPSEIEFVRGLLESHVT